MHRRYHYPVFIDSECDKITTAKIHPELMYGILFSFY